MADPFSALGDGQRQAIVRMLGARPMTVGELSAQLPISRPAVSRHLRVLKDAGLVRARPQGTRRIYELDDAGLEEVRALLVDAWGDAVGRFRLVAENTTPR